MDCNVLSGGVGCGFVLSFGNLSTQQKSEYSLNGKIAACTFFLFLRGGFAFFVRSVISDPGTDMFSLVIQYSSENFAELKISS